MTGAGQSEISQADGETVRGRRGQAQTVVVAVVVVVERKSQDGAQAPRRSPLIYSMGPRSRALRRAARSGAPASFVGPSLGGRVPRRGRPHTTAGPVCARRVPLAAGWTGCVRSGRCPASARGRFALHAYFGPALSCNLRGSCARYPGTCDKPYLMAAFRAHCLLVGVEVAVVSLRGHDGRARLQ